MDASIFWGAMGGIFGALSFFLALYLAWPEIEKRRTPRTQELLDGAIGGVTGGHIAPQKMLASIN